MKSITATRTARAEFSSATVDVRELLLDRASFGPDEIETLRRAVAGEQLADVRQCYEDLVRRINAGDASERPLLTAGVTAYLIGRPAEAEKLLARVMPDGIARYYRAQSLAGLGRYSEAAEEYRHAASAGYDPIHCKLCLVGMTRMLGRIDEAAQLLQQISREAATRAEYSYQKGCILADQGDTYGAIEYFERAVDMDPHHTGALFRLAGENNLMGNDEEAVRLYERALSKPPLHLGAMINLGLLYEDHENYAAAAFCFHRVLTAYPDHERARLFLKDIEASGHMFYDEEESRRQRLNEQLMRIPITDFELSARSRNCLEQSGIKTLGDLTRVTEQELLAGKNFGETSLSEVREILRARGLSIGHAVREERTTVPAFFAQDISPEERQLLESSVGVLNLSVRSRKCLSRLGINTLGELIGRSPDELIAMRNFGVTSLNEIRSKLSEHGLKLRND